MRAVVGALWWTTVALTSPAAATPCDADGDGFRARACGGPDCNDTIGSIHPGAQELPDGIDQDCDGQVDEGTVRADSDRDGWSRIGGDCDDADPTVRPGALERCDGIDQDCDLVIDEGTPCGDEDGDGFTPDDGDCHDLNPAVYPGAPDPAGDGIDQNCDGVLPGDDADPDGDGVTVQAGDCAPDDVTRSPWARELPDGIDQDCDGIIDEGTVAGDDDGDGWSEDDGDCHDGDASIFPNALERLNGRDDDCDGQIDENNPNRDQDGDGVSEVDGDCAPNDASRAPGVYDVPDDGVDQDCDGTDATAPSDLDGDGFLPPDDCDDTDGWRRPGLNEWCDERDNDCDGAVDEGCDGSPATPTPAGCAHVAGSSAFVALAALVMRRRRWT